MKRFLSIIALGLIGLSTNALAADPTWFTDLSTALAAILVMAGTALGGIIAIRLVPMAWEKLKPMVLRG